MTFRHAGIFASQGHLVHMLVTLRVEINATIRYCRVIGAKNRHVHMQLMLQS